MLTTKVMNKKGKPNNLFNTTNITTIVILLLSYLYLYFILKQSMIYFLDIANIWSKLL